MPSPTEFLTTHRSRRAVLYYPGAGIDPQPLDLFPPLPQPTRVIYTDYQAEDLRRREEVESLPAHIDSTAQYVTLAANDFGCDTWAQFWFDDPKSSGFRAPDHAFGISWQLKSPSVRRFRFDYLATEGIGTFLILLQAGIKPNIVVLQDHGFGCNWTTYGGVNELYSLALEGNALPSLLLVATNTKPWPGYEQVSDEVHGCGEANHSRALFARRRTNR